MTTTTKKRTTKPRKTALPAARTRKMLPRKAKGMFQHEEDTENLDSQGAEEASKPAAHTAIKPEPEMDSEDDWYDDAVDDMHNAEDHYAFHLESEIRSRKARGPQSPTSTPTAVAVAVCGTCIQRKKPSEMVGGDEMPAACHACFGDICHACLEMYLDHYFFKANGNSLDLKCPFCAHAWELGAVRALLGTRKLDLSLERMTHRSLETAPLFRWCAADQCPSGQMYHADAVAAEEKVCCAHCGSVNCFECRVVWHAGLSCAEFQDPDLRKHRGKRAGNAEVRMAMRRGETRRCPHCGSAVERSDGCDSVFCTTCAQYFDFGKATRI